MLEMVLRKSLQKPW